MGRDPSEQLKIIRRAYDRTVRQYLKGVDPLEEVPEEFRESPDFRAFMKETGPSSTGSDAPENRRYLSPKKGMRFLDAGCGANLARYGFHRWPSTFYGVDISPALIREMKKFVARRGLSVGGLQVAETADMPFEDDTFDIAMLIGVLEYYPLEYVQKSLEEMSRVLKPSARLVLDLPNPGHPHFDLMSKLEAFLKRPHIPKSRKDFERVLEPFFIADTVDDSRVMLKYFVRNRKSTKLRSK